MERREAVPRQRRRLCRIGVQNPVEAVEPAERGGLEHRQLVVRGQQLPCLLGVSRVESLQRLAHVSSLRPIT
jgi:hypothetical protein